MIWSPAHNAYYFFNSATREATWVNPSNRVSNKRRIRRGKGKERAASETKSDDGEAEGQDKDNEEPGTVAGPSTQWEQMQANAIAQGIDPSLAYLDPSLAVGPSREVTRGLGLSLWWTAGILQSYPSDLSSR